MLNSEAMLCVMALERHGLDPDRDLQCVVRAPGDYQMDLRRLRDGSIDASGIPDSGPGLPGCRWCPSVVTCRNRLTLAGRD